MLHRVRLMFLTAVLVLFASFPSMAAPHDGAQSQIEYSSVSFNVVGDLPAPINHNDIFLLPDDGTPCYHCHRSEYCDGNGVCYYPPITASVSVISFYIDSGEPADTARERQRV